MKKLLLLHLLTLLTITNLFAQEQELVRGISPSNIVGYYSYTWAESWGSTPDINNPGTFVQDTLMLVEDGTANSQQGCNPLINDLTGKIAVLYRGACEFGIKALNAQNAGAVGVIIINNSGFPIAMSGGSVGDQVTIPVVMISTDDGLILTNEMQNNPVVILIGNRKGQYINDIGLHNNKYLRSNWGGAPNKIDNGFDIGIQIYNYGTNAQSNVSVNASINGPAGNIYNQTVSNLYLNSGDSLGIFPGKPNYFPCFDLGGLSNYPDGDYTLTYTINLLTPDDDDFDNVITSNFKVQEKTISLASLDSNNNPVADQYFRNISNCLVFQDPNASNLWIEGLDFNISWDTNSVNLTGEEFFGQIYQWNDIFTDWNDVNYGFNNVNFVDEGFYTITSNQEHETNLFIPFNKQVNLINNQRYLFCIDGPLYNIFLGTTKNKYLGNENQSKIHTQVNSNQFGQPFFPFNNDYTNSIGARVSKCPGFLANITYSKNSCYGANDGMAVVGYTSGGTAPYSYAWSNNVSNDTITDLSPGTYYVTIIDSTGCVAKASVIINENNQFLLAPIVTNETCSITNDGSITNTLISGGASPINYLWNTGDTTSSINGLDAGTYTYVAIDAEGCKYNGDAIVKTDSVNYQLSVQANPTAGVSPLNVIFDNQTPNLANYNFTWSYGDGTSEQKSTKFVPHTYLVDGLWNVVLIAENKVNGCNDTLYLNDFIYTTGGVYCTHIASINQIGPINFCEGDSVLLTCNNNQAFTYQWNKNGIGISGTDNDSIYIKSNGNYSVTIFENNCPVVSSSIALNIKLAPLPVIIGNGSITACVGGSVTLDAGTGFSSYNWYGGGTSQTYIVTSSGDYTVEVTDANGCKGISAPYVINASFMPIQELCIVGIDSITNYNRIIWEKPFTTGIDSFYIYREGVSANIYAKIGSIDYSSSAIFIDQNSNPAVQAYRYKVSVLDTCGSESALGDYHKTIHLTINQGVGQTWNLIWSHYEGFQFGTYNIYRGSNPNNMSYLSSISSNLNSYTDLTPPGGVSVYYQIEVVNGNQCDPTRTNYGNSRSNIVTDGTVSLSEIRNDEVFRFYPNPTEGKIILETEGEFSDFEIRVFNTLGEIVLFDTSTSNRKELNISNLASNIYYVQISNNTLHRTIKIIKH